MNLSLHMTAVSTKKVVLDSGQYPLAENEGGIFEEIL